MDPSISNKLVHVINNCEEILTNTNTNTKQIVTFFFCVLIYRFLSSL